LQAWVDDVNRHAEGFGYLLERFGLNAVATILNASDVRATKTGTLCQLFLRQASLKAQGLHALTDSHAGFFFVHSSLNM
jgi:hypothetical protein